jgi:enamine deaminase RidA (YjgF/YER057c/UK114 family)
VLLEVTTAAAAVSALHDSMCRRASICGDNNRVERRTISSGSPYEPVAGFAGTAPVMPDGASPPDDAYAQARRCLEIILAALEEAGARPEDVVRTRMFVTDPAHWDGVARAHGEVFGEIRPAATCVVTQLLDPRWLVEIEADAILPGT